MLMLTKKVAKLTVPPARGTVINRSATIHIDADDGGRNHSSPPSSSSKESATTKPGTAGTWTPGTPTEAPVAKLAHLLGPDDVPVGRHHLRQAGKETRNGAVGARRVAPCEGATATR